MDDNFKKELIERLNTILNLKNDKWNQLNKNIKLKYIHHLCSYLEDNNEEKIKTLSIPLKSIKPKKLIQYCKISNTSNANLYFKFNKLIQDYTFKFRNDYINVNKRKYWTFTSLPTDEKDKLLFNYNKIIHNFMEENKIDIVSLIKMLLGSNSNKILINDNEKNYKLLYENNMIKLLTNNLEIILTLKYSSEKITNNIPVKYQINLINKI